MMATEVMGFIACLSLTALSLYGLFVFRRFYKHMAELDELQEEIRKCLEDERCD